MKQEQVKPRLSKSAKRRRVLSIICLLAVIALFLSVAVVLIVDK